MCSSECMGSHIIRTGIAAQPSATKFENARVPVTNRCWLDPYFDGGGGTCISVCFCFSSIRVVHFVLQLHFCALIVVG